MNILASVIMPPFEKGGAYCFAHVGRYVGIMPPFEKGGEYCFAHVGRYVGMSVGRYVGSP